MGVNHGGLHIFVPEEFLDGPDIIALLEELSRETVPKGMAADVFVEPHHTPCLAHHLLQSTLTQVMAADDPRARVFRQTVGGKDVLPDPEPTGTRILPFQRKR
jgi:hypothetical protein